MFNHFQSDSHQWSKIDRDRSYSEAFTYAIKIKNIPEIDCLLSVVKVDLNNVRNFFNSTPLHIAAELNSEESHLEVLQKLLENGADVNLQNNAGKTPFHYLVRKSNVKVVQLFLNFKPNINCKDRDHVTPLYEAVFSGDAKVVQLLVDNGSEIRNCNLQGNTALHRAIEFNIRDNERLEIIEILLKNGADVNAQDRDGKTPIHNLKLINNFETLQLLLNFNADVNIQANNGEIFCTRAIEYSRCKVVNLLVKHGLDIDAVNSKSGATLLHNACDRDMGKAGYLIVKCLAKNGANVNVLDFEGCTPLMRLLAKKEQIDNTSSVYYTEKKIEFFLKYADLSITNPEKKSVLCFKKRKNFWKVTLEILAKRLALGVQVHSNLLVKISNSEDYSDYFEKCTKELAEAKEIKLRESWVTFFNLLVDSKRKLKNYAGNQVLVEDFKKSECEKKFPIYAATMLKNMEKGIIRRKLFNRAAEILSDTLLFSPTHLIVKDILDCLTAEDTLTMTENVHDQI